MGLFFSASPLELLRLPSEIRSQVQQLLEKPANGCATSCSNVEAEAEEAAGTKDAEEAAQGKENLTTAGMP